jgi:hypothetical protein
MCKADSGLKYVEMEGLVARVERVDDAGRTSYILGVKLSFSSDILQGYKFD